MLGYNWWGQIFDYLLHYVILKFSMYRVYSMKLQRTSSVRRFFYVKRISIYLLTAVIKNDVVQWQAHPSIKTKWII